MSLNSYDAFGNPMPAGASLSPCQGGTQGGQAGSFAGRGAEGSVYDVHPTLVYMQARHYDPTIDFPAAWAAFDSSTAFRRTMPAATQRNRVR